MECILDCTFSLDVGMCEQAGKSRIIKAEEATNKSMQIVRGCGNEVGGGVGGRKTVAGGESQRSDRIAKLRVQLGTRFY